MSRINGRFYLKLTANGNLLGEWSNSDPSCDRCFTEAANRTGEVDAGSDREVSRFVGDYVSVWSETLTDGVACPLEIRLHGQKQGVFTVVWQGRFRGEAMLCDDNILVGDYRSQ